MKGVMPIQCEKNGLYLQEQLDCMDLTPLECQLIKIVIPFLKLRKYPKTQMDVVNDRPIAVPIDEERLVKNVTSLPRCSDDSGLIAVGMKRQMKLKNFYKLEMIRPKKIYEALNHLKKYHPAYKGIEIRKLEEWLELNLFQDEDSEDESEMINESQDDEDNENEIDSDNLENIRNEAKNLSQDHDQGLDKNDLNNLSEQDLKKLKNLLHKSKESAKARTKGKEESDLHLPTCLMPEAPENKVVVNNSNETMEVKLQRLAQEIFTIAPGEGFTPTNYMRMINYIVKAFPEIFPDGKYGLDAKRDKKLTPIKFFSQRLMNFNNICAKNPGF